MTGVSFYFCPHLFIWLGAVRYFSCTGKKSVGETVCMDSEAAEGHVSAVIAAWAGVSVQYESGHGERAGGAGMCVCTSACAQSWFFFPSTSLLFPSPMNRLPYYSG